MEDHMKMCRLEEVECEIKEIGCFEKFRREDLEEHMRDKAQTHLSMMAATSVKVQQEFQAKLQEQERRFREKWQEELQAKLQEQERRFGEKCSAQQQEFQEQKRRFEVRYSAQEQELERKLGEQERHFEEMMKELERGLGEKVKRQEVEFEEYKKGTETELEDLKRRCGMSWKFTMENFSKEKAKDIINDWKSPPMYTHPGGYKFCIGIDANGYRDSHGEGVNVDVWGMPGEYDGQLKWPVTAKFTLELINHFENGVNKMCTITKTWRKLAEECCLVCSFNTVPGKQYHFISHSELPLKGSTKTHFLKDDTLHFIISTHDVFLFLTS
jgi:hypothetical protein